MLGIFSGLKNNVPITRKLQTPRTEGIINKLHYRVTMSMCIGCCLLVSCLEWVGNGNRISCVMEGKVDDWTIAENVINTYCFVLTTFTLPKHWNTRVGHESAQIGVGAFNPEKDDQTFKAYYQWVPFVLFFQGMLFYFPHLVFKLWEGGKVKSIIMGLNTMIIDRGERRKKEKILAQYLVDSMGTHNFWALKMIFIDFLNVVNVIGNIYFVDAFLGGEFSTYGMEVLSFLEADPENRIDPMAKVFPRVTKCSYFKYGPSGTVQTHDSICVLPINIMNEKIYVLLWFWLLLLAIISILGLLYHLFFMVTPGFIKMFLRSRTLNQKGLHLEEIGKKFEVGDWKLLYLLSKNMEPLVFGELLRELHALVKDDNGNLKSDDRTSNGTGDSTRKPLIA